MVTRSALICSILGCLLGCNSPYQGKTYLADLETPESSAYQVKLKTWHVEALASEGQIRIFVPESVKGPCYVDVEGPGARSNPVKD